MGVKYEDVGNSTIHMTFTISADEFEKACDRVYEEQKMRYEVEGYEKGEAPRSKVEEAVGKDIFHKESLNLAINEAYRQILEETGIRPVIQPLLKSVSEVKPGQEIIVEAEVITRPEVSLGAYKGIEVKKADVSVSKEELQKELETLQRRYKTNRAIEEDRPVQTCDFVNIDFVGSVDGTEFPGGSAEGYELQVGSGIFIPGFEDQIIGHKAGEAFDVCVTFPAEYQAQELAGKDAVFHVKLNKILKEELPELNDAFAAEISDYKTMREYVSALIDQLHMQKTEKAEERLKEELLETIAAGAVMEIPEPILDNECDIMLRELSQSLQAQRIDLEGYLKYIGQDLDGLMAAFRPKAMQTLRTRFVLDAIAEAEQLEATEEDLDAEFAKMAELYNVDAELIRKNFGESVWALKEDLRTRKAMDLILAEAIFL